MRKIGKLLTALLVTALAMLIPVTPVYADTTGTTVITLVGPAIQYTVDISVGGFGSVFVGETEYTETSADSSIKIDKGSVVTYWIVPATGYVIDTVQYNNADVKSELSSGAYTAPALTADASFAVTFTQGKHEHVWDTEYTVDVAPTCEMAGSKSIYCKECGERKEDSVIEIPALRHDWGEWEVVKEATATEDGIKRRICKNDPSHTEEKTIPATGEAIPEDGFYCSFASGITVYEYTGSAIMPKVSVYNNGKLLDEGTDYTVKYSGNTNVTRSKTGEVLTAGKVTVTGKGNFAVTEALTFRVVPKSLGTGADYADGIKVGAIHIVKNSKATPTITYGNYKLQAKDFTVTDASKKYQENGTMTVTGKGNFEGVIEIPVLVAESKKDLLTISVVADTKKAIYFDPNRSYADAKAEFSSLIKVYSSSDKKKENALHEGKDYLITYPSNLLDAGSKSFTMIGLGEYSGSVTSKFTVKPLAVKADGGNGSIITNAKAVSENHYVFSQTGVTIGSDLTVTYIATDGTPIDLKEGSDYKITYSNNKKVSTDKAKATYTISFLGNYKGTPALKNVKSKSVSIDDYSFTISPAPIANEAHEPYEEGGVQVRVELPDVVYGGKPGIYKSTPYVTINGSTLAASNYVVSYFTDYDCVKPLNNKNKITLAEGQSEASVYVMISAKGSVPGKGNFTGIIKKSYLVKRAVAGEVFDLGKARVTLYQKGYTLGAKTNKKLSSVSFNGKPRHLDDADIGGTVLVEYKVDGKKYEALTEGVDYELVYINNINKGKAVIIVKGKEGSKYIGSVKTGFTISAMKIQK